MIVAIDGPAASGKGTLARMVARHFGVPHLDTGLLYRAVGHDVLKRGGSVHDAALATEIAATVDPLRFPDEAALRAPALGEAASVVSAHPGVRAALLDVQLRFAATPGGAVMDGRDIGTVICPNADMKVFVIADPEVRAARRHRDLVAYDPSLTLETVLEEIRRRDERDSGRSTAPLLKAADAMVVDTSRLSPGEALSTVLEAIAERYPDRAAKL